jgi:hypothetical protein
MSYICSELVNKKIYILPNQIIFIHQDSDKLRYVVHNKML